MRFSCTVLTWYLVLGQLFVKIPRPRDSEVTFSAFVLGQLVIFS